MTFFRAANGTRYFTGSLIAVLAWLSSARAQEVEVTESSRRSQFIQLFDGQSLVGWTQSNGWDSAPTDNQLATRWKVVDGELSGTAAASKSDAIMLKTDARYLEFRLRGEALIPKHMSLQVLGENDQFEFVIDSQDSWCSFEILVSGSRAEGVAHGQRLEPQLNRTRERRAPVPMQFGFRCGHEKDAPADASVRLRNLLLETYPEPELLTLKKSDTKPRIRELPRQVDHEIGLTEQQIWTKHIEAIVPDELLRPVRNTRLPLTSYGVRDSERDAYYALVQKARELPLATLKLAERDWRDARRRLPEHRRYQQKPASEFPMFVDLFRHPTTYHGKLVTLHGHVRKLAELPADENPYGIDRLYEAWLFDEHAQTNPVVVICTSLDARLKPEPESVIDHCQVTGYFFKNMAYDGQKDLRFAPLLIAQKLEYFPIAKSGPSFVDRSVTKITQATGWSKRTIWLIALIAVTVVSVFVIRRSFRRPARASAGPKQIVSPTATSVPAPKPTTGFDKVVDQGSRPNFERLTPAAPIVEPSGSPTPDGSANSHASNS